MVGLMVGSRGCARSKGNSRMIIVGEVMEVR